MIKRSAIILSILFTFSSLSATNFFSTVMKDGVATFVDAAELIYYSFRSNTKTSHNKKDKADEKKLSHKKVKSFLRSKGVDMKVDSRPISRESFAKTLIRRFKLTTSLSTRVFGWKNLYFEDAQKLGIFPRSERGTEALTTKDMLKAFFRARQLSR